MAKKKGQKGKRTLGAVLVLLALFVLIALATHRDIDDARIRGDVEGQLNPFGVSYSNQGGMLGAYLSYLLSFLLGWLAYFIPLGLLSLSLRLFSEELAEKVQLRVGLLFAVAVFATMMVNIHWVLNRDFGSESDAWGGYTSELVTKISVRLLGELGSYLLLGGMIAILLLLYTYFTPFLLGHLRKSGTPSFKKGYQSMAGLLARMISFKWLRASSKKSKPRDELPEALFGDILQEEMSSSVGAEEELSTSPAEFEKPEKVPKKATILKKAAEPVQIKSFNYSYPTVELLNDNPSDSPTVSADELTATARMLKETLETFGVSIEGNIDKYPGPIITRYEFKPGTGIKVNQIVNLADDLALALKAKRIRIIAPIPGKAAVGVEIPNRSPQMVFLRDVLSSNEFKDPSLRLPLAFGKTTSGKPFIADLSRMPHLLIAGATGSGKSVCMNVLITSLIYRMHPMQVRFIFVDPKMLELSVYSGIPHLGRPVVTTARQAEKVFSDTVIEMENRYRRLATASVRNIEDFNRKQEKEEDKLPYIVMFVDELADLMMSSTSSKTEMLITRLAQMARAVGIHLILATQRPSVDVITGLIKANFPARIAFQVSSKVDSRTIIDANGAEKLLGSGDMLFLSTGQPEPVRIHGAYLSSDETDRTVKFIKDQGLGMLALENISQSTGEANDPDIDIADPLFREACEVVIRHKQGSVSLLQRRLGIGYQRAARLIDKLEEAGVVSPFDGSKAREVIVDKAYMDILFANSSGAVKSDAEPN